MKNYLVVILGPTAVGKTTTAIQLALDLHAEIISADSRQFYRELKIGTAAPSDDELKAVKHNFVGHLSMKDYYNVSSFETDVLDFLSSYFTQHRAAVMVGGSGLYIDAVCKGIDALPDPDEGLRERLRLELESEGLDAMKQKLRELDPLYFAEVDLNNPNRILRALEVCMTTGQPFSSLRKNSPKNREFEIIKIGLNRPRPELVEIIHHRVGRMMEAGLLEEVRSLVPAKALNALNTVGYKELFQYLDGEWTLEMAVEKIKTNTRRYAKRQLTWFNKDPEIRWFHPDDYAGVMAYVRTRVVSLQ